MAGRERRRLLPALLPLLPVDNRVLLPGSSMVVHVNDPRGMNLVETQLWNEENWKGKYVGVVPRRSKEEKLHTLGTAASVSQMTAWSHPRPHFSLLLVGLCRFRIDEIKRETPFPIAAVTQLDYLHSRDDPVPTEVRKLAEEFRASADELVDLLDLKNPSTVKLKRLLDSLPDHNLPDLFTSILRGSFQEKLEVLDTVDLSERFKAVQPLLLRQIATMKLLQKASNSALDPTLATKRVPASFRIIRPGGRGNTGATPTSTDESDEISELEQRITSANLPEHALRAAQKEMKRLRTLPPQFPEYAVSRNYLETLLDLPWSKATEDRLDLGQAREDLEADHYGLGKVKKRVLEFLAIRQLKKSLKGPILCFVGAPGVGKTSVGRSIAKTLGRKFYRISLGGGCDQSDIRGHRRTYIGSMPGRIIQGLKTVGTNNPVFLLDEVDKLHKSLQGDPAAALLEVLDPEQNSTFTDHYLNIPFDLSQVLFIATANTSSTIPPPLLDRMEVIEIPGYTQEEKVEIAVRHLLPKQLEQHGLTSDHLTLPPETIARIAGSYTREAGVRNLERVVGSVCRSIVVKVVEKQGGRLEDDGQAVKNSASPIVVTEDMLEEILGPRRYEHELSERLTRPGVAIGLAWTAMGGEILFVEASRMPGTGELTLTGQLGDVMKESARIALNWLRSSASLYHLSCDNLDTTDIHIHFPAGAVGKDGPSAGVTIVTVLASLFSGRCVRSDTAMTGEVTLRGMVLPVGGIKEKVLAAHRAGIRHVIMPKRNEKDLVELPEGVKSDLQFSLVSSLEEVLRSAFEGGLRATSKL